MTTWTPSTPVSEGYDAHHLPVPAESGSGGQTIERQTRTWVLSGQTGLVSFPSVILALLVVFFLATVLQTSKIYLCKEAECGRGPFRRG